ncbi:MAG: LTA synthase family protein [Burkholderiales bacterium]|nr:LTA synthase family protein [Burkholderiales bacterium]
MSFNLDALRGVIRHAAPSGRAMTLAWVVALFLAVNLLVRIGLIGFDGDSAVLLPWRLAAVLGIGTLYDLAALAWVLLPFALLALVCSDSRWGRTVHAALASTALAILVVALCFVAASEWVFWSEFGARFNFIAVDYLIYTREVVGNVRASYPMELLLGTVAAAALLLLALVAKPFVRAALAPAGSMGARFRSFAALLALALVLQIAISDGLREVAGPASAGQLASNGWYEFFRAFRNNDLDYRAFYRVMPAERAHALVRHDRQAPDAVHPRLPLNVVMVSMESLGSDYVESFGGRPGLTPRLDALARQGLMFTDLYATGLRTVRGLEALTLSVPPTPGHAVPMRKHNKGFSTVGGAFAKMGYEPLFLYGGYAYFDNMRDFFGGNGYTVIDRTDIAQKNINHETVWGVADEDLFAQALREIDARAKRGSRFYAHILTTSNHRPFTYPNGRIDIPSGSGRDGAVKYTDWAVGRFMDEAKKQPWFLDTLFVFVADHTSNGRGRTDLPPANYRIPFFLYAPRHVAPGRVPWTASQIDVGPTVLALLGAVPEPQFFGTDILRHGREHPRAFMANYLTVGYMDDGLIVELTPRRGVRVVDAATGDLVPNGEARAAGIIDQAVANYQMASDRLRGPMAAARWPTVGSDGR